MKSPQLASIIQCTGCSACAAICPVTAIHMSQEKDGHYYPKINPDVCVGCLQCEKVCPIQSSFEYGHNSMKSVPYKAWNTDDDQRLKSSSGGVFSALAYSFMRSGGYVAGAIIDGLKVRHIVSCNVEDIELMQGSKYLQSETAGAFGIILDLLPNNKVLFSGTGCQVAGLQCLVRKKNIALMSNLYCVDIVCDGVPSYRLLEKTIERFHGRNISIVSFRNKSKGWSCTPKELSLKIDGVEHNFGQSNLMICGFNRSLTSRYSCYDCRYAFTDRLSDITLADFWGIKCESKEDLFKGISLAVVHNDKGRQLLDDSSIHYNDSDWSAPTSVNFRLYNGKKYGFSETWLRRHIGWMFDHLSYDNLLRLYGACPISRFDVLGKLASLWYKAKNKKMKQSFTALLK